MRKLPLIASVDVEMRDRKTSIISFLAKLQEVIYPVNCESCESVTAKLRGIGLNLLEDEIDLLLSFDPKTCTIPFTYCNGYCGECCYDPLKALLEPYTFTIEHPKFIITRQDIIKALFDSIEMLINACKICASEQYSKLWL